MYIAVYNLYVYSMQYKIVYNTRKFCGVLITNYVAHQFLWRTKALVRHKNPYLWRMSRCAT
jgi:hypothetical protein